MSGQQEEGVLSPPSKRRRVEARGKIPAKENVMSWSKEDVTDYLRDRGISEAVLQVFENNAIEGGRLLQLTEDDLTNMGISDPEHRKDILAAVHKLKNELDKVFNDPIHGHIELHPLMVKIIDTPQFQRLRYIKQLGGGYYVFPGASHNRFEHSIGVGYLAGELVETLQRKQPELEITNIDVLCVKIAGLCHDLGHGPFSHMFDKHFIPKVLPDSKWKHEQASVMMFQHLINENGLMADLELYGLNNTDVDFIKEQIAGPQGKEPVSSKTDPASVMTTGWQYLGRPESKSFLYEIVANKRNGIDVDKWDYFARDCHHLGITNSFDMKRYMKFVRVVNVDKEGKQICTRDKEVLNLYEMFHTRHSLHRRAYQHKTVNIIETMITEALIKANDHLLFPGRKGPVKMSEAIYDPHAYTRLTDCVVHQILTSTDPKLSEAKDILEKVERRELYKYIGQTQPTTHLSQSEVLKEIIGSLSTSDLGDLPTLTEDDIIVEVVTYNYGQKDGNPIDNVSFYLKNNPEETLNITKEQVSRMLPEVFQEHHIRVFCKKTDKNSLAAASRYYYAWSGNPADGVTPYFTPMKKKLQNQPHTPSENITKQLFS